MDKSWMQLQDRLSPIYIEGIQNFINFASKDADALGRIRCPCKNCRNSPLKKIVEVKHDLLRFGMMVDYIHWVYHGESTNSNTSQPQHSNCVNDHVEPLSDDIPELLQDLHRGKFFNSNIQQEGCDTFGEEEKFLKLWNKSQQDLYPGCQKYTRLSFLVRMVHNKIMTNSSIKSFNLNLELFKDALPKGETLPKNYYEVRKLLRELGLGYTNVDVCLNDCTLYWKDNENLDRCLNPKCQEPRWKDSMNNNRKISQKVAKFFPIKARLQRLFMSKDIAKDMRWHKEKRIDDGVLRHPADGEEWKEFDNKHRWFAQDSRNIRLGLSSDGFNPFGNMSTSYSMWPVFLVVYNLPPWLCMKEAFHILVLLIPGKDSPGNDIDVYLQPVIDELKSLWLEGIETYDAYSCETFTLHAALLWTINDFPALGMLSGWSTKGKLACPICNKDTDSYRLKHGAKECYMGHRRFLDEQHIWRKSRKINGKQELRAPPNELTGDDILSQLDYVPTDLCFGKSSNQKKRKRGEHELNWTKRSIFFDLPYWKTLNIRHNLDVMHIEKNICENVLGTLLDIEGKTKDNSKARMDLEVLGVKKDLHLQRDDRGNIYMPMVRYTFDRVERKKFCQWLKNIKFPDGYASNLSRCISVSEGKLSGMKSHDYHIFMQRILPLVAQGFLYKHKDICSTISELSDFFKEMCSKRIEKTNITKLQESIILILCKLEMIYPPSFFVIMMHLAIHLPRQVLLGGPVQYRWMYPTERLMRTLKDVVRNKARPEGSIAEAYIAKECLNFCSFYLHGVETKFNRADRNYEGHQTSNSKFSVFSQKARPMGAPTFDVFSKSELETIQWYILDNCIEVDPYKKLHLDELLQQHNGDIQKIHHDQFPNWFKNHVIRSMANGSITSNDDVYTLGLGPDSRVAKYSGIIINGVRFHTIDREQYRHTQNSGVKVKGEHKSDQIDFLGVLKDIIELQYCHGMRIFVLKCDWWNVGDSKNGIKKDGKIVSVNMSRKWYIDDPYVLADQVEQVFYVDDIKMGENWKYVQQSCQRSLFDVAEIDDVKVVMNDEPYQQFQSNDLRDIEIIDDQNMQELCRNDIPAELINPSMLRNVANAEEQNLTDISSEDGADDTMIDYLDDTSDTNNNNDSDNIDEDEI